MESAVAVVSLHRDSPIATFAPVRDPDGMAARYAESALARSPHLCHRIENAMPRATPPDDVTATDTARGDAAGRFDALALT
jgi:hypothetical protein